MSRIGTFVKSWAPALVVSFAVSCGDAKGAEVQNDFLCGLDRVQLVGLAAGDTGLRANGNEPVPYVGSIMTNDAELIHRFGQPLLWQLRVTEKGRIALWSEVRGRWAACVPQVVISVTERSLRGYGDE